MRYTQYKSIIELSESLHEALVYMQQTKNTSLINDCITVLSTIAEFLEDSTEKEVEKPIETITEIVELFEDVQGNIERLAELSERFATECKTELKYKFRILFVAELSSKWDSMKSVYEAFIKRADCEVDVVLQPIFRTTKLPDGSTRSEIIYGDWLTPMGIKNISFKSYDMEKIMPDITFISQPYESVTIPQFWPQNIAKYSKLVYLPYFTATTMEIESIYTSFLKMPIEYYAWKIVCQSDEMKKYYEKHASRKGENVIVTGLPKWDYPMSLNKKNTPLPEEWKEKLAGRKVFLFNTHYTSWFKSPKSFYRNILNIFLERDDIAMIWRPHPMTEVVNKLYIPEQYKAFKEWESIVADSKNIVEDLSETYDAAFTYSDALITPLSSIVQQYLLMKKPICLLTDVKREPNSLFDFSKFCTVFDPMGVEAFVNAVLDGSMENKDMTEELIGKYFNLSDGSVGERISRVIIDEFTKGDING